MRKIEFNPFKKNEFVAVFGSYFIQVDFVDVKYESRFVGEKKIIDFNFNPNERDEFLLSGGAKTVDSHYFCGYLNVHRFV